MAWLQTDPSSGNQHICFRFAGERFRRSLGTKDKRKARRKLARLEDTLELIEMGRIELPTNVDVPTFLLSEGKLQLKHSTSNEPLDKLFDAFFESIPDGALEERTVAQMKSHRVHLERHFKTTFCLPKLSFSDLQTYVAKRSKGKGIRGRNTNPKTIKKEIVTLRSLWNWSVSAGRIPKAVFPSNGLRYPKSTELPIFQTFDEVAEQTKSLDPDSNEAKDLWSSVFLNRDEIESLLDHIQKTARHDFIYPMFVFAAHTGARRGEILRSQLVDIGKDSIAIRERKRKKRTNSMRHVPISRRTWHASFADTSER